MKSMDPTCEFTDTCAYKFDMISEGSWASGTQNLPPPINPLVGCPEVKESTVRNVVYWVQFGNKRVRSVWGMLS